MDVVRRISLLVTACLLGIAVMLGAVMSRPAMSANVAKELGVAPSEVALAWLLQKRGVAAPIVGATKIEHLESAVRALDVELSADQVSALEQPYQPHAVRGH